MPSTPNRIFLGPGAELRREDGKTDEAVTPGQLLELGGTNDLQKHSVAGGIAQGAMFALEPDIVEAAAKLIDEAYASGDIVPYMLVQRGERVYAWLAPTTDASAAGTLLESDGLGALRIAAGLAALTRAGGFTGTADGELEDVTATFAEAPLENNFEEVAAKLDTLLAGGHNGIVARVPIGEGVNNASGSAVRIVVEVL